jgi:hypothetical protein
MESVMGFQHQDLICFTRCIRDKKEWIGMRSRYGIQTGAYWNFTTIITVYFSGGLRH